MLQIPSVVRQCVQTLEQAGFEACPVGGCVRDSLLGRLPGDWDITTSALPEDVQRLFAKTVPTGLAHGTVTVLLEDTPLEVTTFRGESGYSDSRHPDRVTFGVTLQEDLARRDFTVNAMAMTLSGGLIDPFGGQIDLQNRLLRAVGDAKTRFTEDALRMFRAIRFSAQLGFALDEEILAAIPALSGRAQFLAKERIKTEVEKTLLSPAPERVALFFTTGLLSGADVSVPLDALAALPAEPGPRWREFCRLTGFDITTLPMERKTRAAVLHPEREAVKTLALQGKDLMALGYAGQEIGKVQRALALHILAHPEDNEGKKLRELLRDLVPENLPG